MKQKLEKINDGDTNMYNHLLKVIKQLIINNDKDGYQLFEYYSQAVKEGKAHQPPYRNVQFDQLKNYVQNTKNLLAKVNTGTQEQPSQPGPTGYVPNLMEQSKWFERAGIGFGQQTTYLLFKSLEKLSITRQIKELKFWGKIICSGCDYFVAQCPAEGGQQGQLPPDVQPKGTGINKSAYWVCTKLSGQWKQLPIINPQQLTISRKIKHVFTGDLEHPIITNPLFPGKQAHLLKCQIVRITFSCTLIPRTMFNVNAEDKKQIEAAQQWKIPGFQFLSKIQNWVHHPQNILRNGRLTLLKAEIPEGVQVDQQKLMKQLQAKDPLQQRLKSIAKDQSNQKKLWAIKVLGDTCEYRAMSKNKQQVNYGFIWIKSLTWKGWSLIYHNKQWTSIYVGNGFKCTSDWYFPSEPELVLNERQDNTQQPQPNFPPQSQKKPQQQPQQPVQ